MYPVSDEVSGVSARGGCEGSFTPDSVSALSCGAVRRAVRCRATPEITVFLDD